MIERKSCQLISPFRHHSLYTNRFVLVDVQIEHVDFTLGGDSGENRRRIRRPFHIPHTRTHIKHKQWLPIQKIQLEKIFGWFFVLRSVVFPDFDAPIAAARCENVGVEFVEVYTVDGHMVGVQCEQIH